MVTQTENSWLKDFIAEATLLADSSNGACLDTPSMLACFYTLICEAEWLPQRCPAPETVHYQQYLLYCDPFERFSLVVIVWNPGRYVAMYDPEVWGYIGILRGAVLNQRYERKNNGSREANSHKIQLDSGDIELLSPKHGDTHYLTNALNDQITVSIHLYGGFVETTEIHSGHVSAKETNNILPEYFSASLSNPQW